MIDSSMEMKESKLNEIRTLPANSGLKMEPIGPIIHDWAHLISFQPQLYFRTIDLEEHKSFLISIFQGASKQKNAAGAG